jgi:periplasmic divalent cation tolerance protein
MKIIYTTLNNTDEVRKIGREVLSRKLANCVNFFPITCIYNYENEITEEPEVVLIIKTKEGKYSQIEQIIKEHITYDNFIGELNVDQINSNFECWLCAIVK